MRLVCGYRAKCCETRYQGNRVLNDELIVRGTGVLLVHYAVCLLR